MSYGDEQRILVEALQPLAAVLGEMILVGGWAHRLHAYHPLASRDGHLLATVDADLFVPEPSRSIGPRIENLRAAGFRIRMGGQESPPVTEYVLARGGLDFELEFLASRPGAEVDRRGRRRNTILFGDAVAQLLPFMYVMVHEPWTFTLDLAHGFPIEPAPLTLRVVAPAPYVAHKLMVLKDRQPTNKRYQDVRYLYETIRRFAPTLSALQASWSRRAWSIGERRRLAAGRRFVREGTLIASAARTPDLDGNTADAKHMREVLELGFEEIFGPLGA